MSASQTVSDLQLLERYTRDHAEDAFAEIVRRHLNLVYSAALRQVRSPQLAEEVAQSAFIDLTRNATKLSARTGAPLVLTAWLYQVTRLTAIDVVRREARRQLREQIATEMNAMNATADDWTHIEPLLDEAVSALDDTDRTAVLLRYFENKSLREVGQQLGVSDDAAQKRVSRAVERLREFFGKRGITIGTSGLVVVITANAVQAAPVGLATTIAASTAVAAITTATAAAAKAVTMTTMQKAAVTAAIAMAVGAGIYETRHASSLRDTVEAIQQQHAVLSDEVERLKREREEAAASLENLRKENEQLQADHSELIRLQSEAERLRNDSMELAAIEAGFAHDENGGIRKELLEWVVRVNKLKKRVAETSEARIPEFEFLTDGSWFGATEGRLSTDEDYRQAMASLRNGAGAAFGKKAYLALRQYIRANQGQFPTDVSQLKSYFVPPINEAILQRYKIVSAKGFTFLDDRGDWVIVTKEPLDKKYDLRTCVAANDYTSGARFGNATGNWATSGVNDAMSILKPAIEAYSKDNYGLLPYDHLSELTPYVTTDEQRAALEPLLDHR